MSLPIRSDRVYDLSRIDEIYRLYLCTQETRRRLDCEELYRIFTHDWKRDLQIRLRRLFSEQTWEHLRLQADISMNLLRWVSDELACIYAEPPTRSLDGIDDPDILAPYESDGALDHALDQAARMCFAFREVVLRPLAHRHPRPHIILDVIPPHRVFAIPSGDHPTKTACIIVQLDEYRYGYWDARTFALLDPAFKIIRQEANPYGAIPYIIAHAQYPARGFWHWREACGLWEATYAAAVARTDFNHLRRLQSFKQIWIRTDADAKDLQSILTDPAGAIRLRGNAEAGILDLESDLEKHVHALQAQISSVLALYGIHPDVVRGMLEAGSGYALAIKLLAQKRAWARQRRVWQVWENDLYQVARRVLAVDGGVRLPDAPLNIEWANLEPPTDPQQDAYLLSNLINSGIISRAEARRRLRMTEEKSKEMDREILEERPIYGTPAPLNIPELPETTNGVDLAG